MVQIPIAPLKSLGLFHFAAAKYLAHCIDVLFVKVSLSLSLSSAEQ